MIITTSILNDFLYIAHHASYDLNDYAVIQFADQMMKLGSVDKTAYLAVRDEVCRQIKGEVATQRALRAEGNALKAAGQGDRIAFLRCRNARLNNREDITLLIKLRRLSKLWAAHAMAGDPLCLRIRERLVTEARIEHANAEQEKANVEALINLHKKVHDEAQRKLWIIERENAHLKKASRESYDSLNAAHREKAAVEQDVRMKASSVAHWEKDLTRAQSVSQTLSATA